MGTSCFNCVLLRIVLTNAYYDPILSSSPQKSHQHLLVCVFIPAMSCLSITFWLLNVTSPRLTLIENFRYVYFHSEFLFLSSLAQGYLCSFLTHVIS